MEYTTDDASFAFANGAKGEPLVGSPRPSRSLLAGIEYVSPPGGGSTRALKHGREVESTYCPMSEDWQRVRTELATIERSPFPPLPCPGFVPREVDFSYVSERDAFGMATIRMRLARLSPGGTFTVEPVVTSSGSKLWQWADGLWRLYPEPVPGDAPLALGLSNSAKVTAQRAASVEVYRHDVRIRRKLVNSETRTKLGGARRRIACFSRESRNRLLFTARNTPCELPTMITLTYPGEFPCNGRIVKKHWSIMRKWLIRRNMCGLMLQEFQQRGAPHLHLYCNNRIDKKAVAEAWYRIVDSGNLDHLKAGTRVEKMRKRYAMLMYIVKYIKKQEQKVVPPGFEEVGRFWSLWGGLKVTAERVISGTVKSVAQTVRFARRIHNARHRSWGFKGMKDTGWKGFLLWDVSEAFRANWERLTGECDGFKPDGWGVARNTNTDGSAFRDWCERWERDGKPVEALRFFPVLQPA